MYVCMYVCMYVFMYVCMQVGLCMYVCVCIYIYIYIRYVLNRLVQFNVIRRYVKTNSIHTTHRLNALAAPPGIRV